jgi:lipopolysaccharide export LptBFGC system permease protein LptF
MGFQFLWQSLLDILSILVGASFVVLASRLYFKSTVDGKIPAKEIASAFMSKILKMVAFMIPSLVLISCLV